MTAILRNVAAFAAIALICTSVRAQDEAPAPPGTGTEVGPSQGVETNSNEGNFSVRLPTKSSYSNQDVPTDLGPIKMHIFASEEDMGNVAYMVFYSDYPEAAIKASSPKDLLNSAQGGAIGSVENAKIVTEQEITINGHPGKQVIFHGGAPDESVSAAWRLYLVKNRLYQIGIISIGKPIDGNKLDMTFDSFKLNN